MANEVASGISFVDIQGGWNQFNPILRLKNASVTLPNRNQPISVDEMAVELDLVKSAWLQSPVIREISGAIKNLKLKKDSGGQWWLNETYLGGVGESSSPKTNIATLLSNFPHYLDLEIKQLIIIDQNSGRDYEINWIQLDLQQHKDSFHLELATSLPASLGDELLMKAIVKPESSLVYVKSDRIELAGLGALFDLGFPALQKAELSGEVWLNLVERQVVGFNSHLSVNEGLVQLESENLLYSFALSGQINAAQHQGRWTFSNQIEALKINNNILQPFNSEIRVATSNQQTLIEGWTALVF